jgi:outer membrane lipoprotein-sorting protein
VTVFAACFIALALTLSSTAAAQAPITPAEILQRVSAAVTPEVAFREVRTTRLLKTPLVSSGVLRYFPPNRLERETRQPVQETVVIEDLQVTIDRAGTQTVVSLVSGSAPAAMVETLRAVLGGRMRELDARYKVSALGSSERWSLNLEPRAADGVILVIKLAGRGATVEEIEVLERSGDKTVTLLSR